MRLIPVPFALAVLVLGQSLSAAQAADAENGRRLAGQWCSTCHVIDSRGTGTARDTAPSFASVAADPARVDPDHLAAWLMTGHKQMPNFNLTRDSVADLVAYIRSLGPAR